MPNRNHRLLVVLLAAGATAIAQTASPDAEKPATVRGVVINSVTGEPLVRVHVTLSGSYNPSVQGAPQTYGAMTNAEGKFSIAPLPPDSYYLLANRVGFELAVSPGGIKGSQVSVKAGDQKDDIKLKLVPQGAISGRIVDAQGEPVEGVYVKVESGSFGNRPPVITDDQGHFRLGGLSSGKYRVKATPMNFPLAAEIRTDGSVEVHYAPTYFPSTLIGKSASRITVTPGSEISDVEIKLVRTPIVRVSGTVAGVPPGARYVTVSAQHDGGGNGVQVKPDGSFEVWRPDPGKYTLSATSRSGNQNLQSAPLEIEVSDSDIDHVDLRLVSLSDISGMVQFEDEQAKPQGVLPRGQMQDNQQPPRPPRPKRLYLQSVTGAGFGGQHQAEIAPDGSFTLRQVPPGRFAAKLSWNNAYVKSVRLGQAEMPDGIIDLRNGAAGAALSVLVSSGLAEISGVVRDGDDPAPRRFVTLVPEPFDGAGSFGETSGPDGSYRFRGIRPGRYKLVVVDAGEWSGLLSGAELEDYPDALDISIGAGEKLVKDLRVRPDAR